MEQLEKVEKLRQRANVSYEDAKAALVACEWDLLDAMVYLEKLGKVSAPMQTAYSTSYEEQAQLPSVKERVENAKDPEESLGKKLARLAKKLFKKSKENYFCVNRNGENLVKVPVWALVLILIFAWWAASVLIIVGLFLDCHYSFTGKDDLSKVNDVMEGASNLADKAKEEFNKL